MKGLIVIASLLMSVSVFCAADQASAAPSASLNGQNVGPKPCAAFNSDNLRTEKPALTAASAASPQVPAASVVTR